MSSASQIIAAMSGRYGDLGGRYSNNPFMNGEYFRSQSSFTPAETLALMDNQQDYNAFQFFVGATGILDGTGYEYDMGTDFGSGFGFSRPSDVSSGYDNPGAGAAFLALIESLLGSNNDDEGSGTPTDNNNPGNTPPTGNGPSGGETPPANNPDGGNTPPAGGGEPAAGGNNPTPPPPPKPPTFADKAYETLLGRQFGIYETDKKISNVGQKSDRDVVTQIVDSDEFKNKNYSREQKLQLMHQLILGRDATPEELAKWNKKMNNNGLTIQNVKNQLFETRNAA